MLKPSPECYSSDMLLAMAKYSVILPYHNGSFTIRRALGSILEQSMLPQEIIVINDFSEVEEAKFLNALVKELEKKVKFIVLNNAENVGQSTSRNRGAKLATTEHILFLDQDDIWHRQHACSLMDTLGPDCKVAYSQYKKEMIFLGVPRCVPSRLPNTVNVALLGSHGLSRNLGVIASSLGIEKRLFLALGGFDASLRGMEDEELLVRLVAFGFEAKTSDEFSLTWTYNALSSSRSAEMILSRSRYLSALASSSIRFDRRATLGIYRRFLPHLLLDSLLSKPGDRVVIQRIRSSISQFLEVSGTKPPSKPLFYFFSAVLNAIPIFPRLTISIRVIVSQAASLIGHFTEGFGQYPHGASVQSHRPSGSR